MDIVMSALPVTAAFGTLLVINTLWCYLVRCLVWEVRGEAVPPAWKVRLAYAIVAVFVWLSPALLAPVAGPLGLWLGFVAAAMALPVGLSRRRPRSDHQGRRSLIWALLAMYGAAVLLAPAGVRLGLVLAAVFTWRW